MNILKTLLKKTEPELKKYVTNFLKERYSRVIEDDQYVVAVGDIPIALCAHLDTVWVEGCNFVLHDQEKDIYFSPLGAGFDDRAGVMGILEIIDSGLRPHVIFTCGEETGGFGAYQLSQKEIPFAHLIYIIELDRMGWEDCVFYADTNEEFHKYVESFGFKTEFGSFSDISILCSNWGVAGVNLSIGYMWEHTKSEIFCKEWYNQTIKKVKDMLMNPPKQQFKYITKGQKIDYGTWFGSETKSNK